MDLGTGTGIQSIFSSSKATKVVATDINPKAIDCAKINIDKHRLNQKIKIIKSDLFSGIQDKFDLIIFNPPFRWFKPRDILEQGELDENYKTLNKFFIKVKKYLKPNGRILLVFSNSGDIKYFESLIKKSGFKCEIIKKQKSNNWNYVVYKLTFS